MAALLEVEGLTTRFRTDDGVVKAVTDMSFSMEHDRTLAVVGESGSGKSVAAMSIMRLLPTAEISGTVIFDGISLLDIPERQMRSIRGNDIAMIFQDPMTALNPVFTVGDQIAEAIRVHNRNVSKKAAWDRAAQLLDLVGIPLAKQRVKNYPHEFSGGMRQRAMIAMAISNDPKLLIADEPTTALDVTIQAQVMEAMIEAQRATEAAMMLITHDLGLVASAADRIHVMYAGQIFESGSSDEIFYESGNPYTRGLISSIPRLNAKEAQRLETIRGAPPSLIYLPRGCAFRPRCDYATEQCFEEPPLHELDGPGRLTRCHNFERLPDPVRSDPEELPTWSR
jgi:oligopeptide/dipeptide ABC transporter ATP-binding protein